MAAKSATNMHGEDVASGLVAMFESKITGTVKPCSEQATTIRDVVLTIARILDRPDLVQLGAIPARSND